MGVGVATLGERAGSRSTASRRWRLTRGRAPCPHAWFTGARRRARSAAIAVLLLLLQAVGSGCSLLAGSEDDAVPAQASAPAEIPVPPAATPAAGSALVARAATRIERVSVESTPPTTRVVLELDGGAEPEVSLLVNQRLVVDVPGTTAATLPRVIEVTGDLLVERVRTGQHAAPELKSRVVVDLRERADFTVRRQDDRIVVLLAPATPESAPAAAASGNVLLGAEPGGSAREATNAPGAVSSPSGAGRSAAGDPADAPPAPTPLGPAEAPPVPATEGFGEASPMPTPGVFGDTPPLPTPEAPAETEDPPTPNATSPTLAELPPLPEATRRAERISIDFTEADVRTVIDLIAAAGGYRVIFTPEVGGTISITLVDRPFEDALATVLHAKGLREVRHEDVMLVSRR